MHDIDRISLENPYGQYETNREYSQFETNEFSQYENQGEYYEGEGEDEYSAQYDLESESDYENDFEDSYEAESDYEFSDSPFSEAEEMALASELLNVSNEAELDQFIGKILRRGFKTLLGGQLGSQLGGIIKGAAKTALPLLGAAAGNLLIPGAGGAMGSKLASAAGSMLGLELEGLSREDQEFQLARQIVRFGGAAARNAEEIEQSKPGPPLETAHQAAVAAAQQYAPGLLRPNADQGIRKHGCGCSGRRTRRREGRWVRRGNKILIIGV